MIDFILRALEEDSNGDSVGRSIAKKFSWSVLPRAGDYITFYPEGDLTEINSIDHNLTADAKLPEINVWIYTSTFNHILENAVAWNWSIEE